MSLERNILANYASQFYVTLIIIVMVPMYVTYMGAEAFGLVGFFGVLQAWFQLLDIGLTPTMARETARFRGGELDALSLRRLLRALEGIFVVVALLGAAAVMAGAGTIASRWLGVQQLPLDEVQRAIMLMAVIVALRWVSGLYRGAINGMEDLIWLSGFNVAVATARFVLVIPFFMFVSTSATAFFSYQLAVALIEVTLLVIQTYRLVPSVKVGQHLPWQWRPLRGVLKFSLSITFTSSVGVLITQTDKLVLSSLLPLTDYAYFTLAVLVASGVMAISVPLSSALLPRLSRLSAEGDAAGVIALYRKATQLMGVLAVPAALVFAFFPEQVLWVWTGDVVIARKAAPILTLYVVGNVFYNFAAFPYYLQFSKGDLRLHVIGNALFAAIFLPLLIWASTKYGAIGAGYAWILCNLLPFIIWLPIVHGRFAKGLHAKWLLHDVAPIVICPTIVAFLLHEHATWPKTQYTMAFGIVLVGSVLCAIAASCSSWIRERIRSGWRAKFVG